VTVDRIFSRSWKVTRWKRFRVYCRIRSIGI